MKENIGFTSDGKFNEATLIMDCAEIQHEIWRQRGYGANNPNCDVPFDKLTSDERMKNYFSVEAVLKALKAQGLLKDMSGVRKV